MELKKHVNELKICYSVHSVYCMVPGARVHGPPAAERNNDGQWVADCGSASGLAQARHHHPTDIANFRPSSPDRHRQLSANLEPDFSVEGRGTSGGRSAQRTPLHKWAATALSVGVQEKTLS